MTLNNLKPARGSVKTQGKRIGRGQGSGKGGTATRGNKGAKSRSGYSRKVGFEGGQMPLQRRVPKFGFTNINRKEYVGVNLHKLQELVDNNKITDTVTMDILIENRLAYLDLFLCWNDNIKDHVFHTHGFNTLFKIVTHFVFVA